MCFCYILVLFLLFPLPSPFGKPTPPYIFDRDFPPIPRPSMDLHRSAMTGQRIKYSVNAVKFHAPHYRDLVPADVSEEEEFGVVEVRFSAVRGVAFLDLKNGLGGGAEAGGGGGAGAEV